MTVLLVLCMLTIFLVVDAVIQRMHASKAIEDKSIAYFAVPDGRKLALNHTWLKEEDDGSYTLGLDAFLGDIVGKLDRIILPDAGAIVAPASMNIGLAQGSRMLQLSAPISGRILEVNQKVLRDPSCVLKDPYGSGWFARIRPKAGPISPGFFVADTSGWIAQQVGKSKDFFVSNLDGHQAAFMQDGGGLVAGVLQHYDTGVWDEFQKQFISLPDIGPSEGRLSHGNK